MRTALIVGAGLAGLTAARHLMTAGWQVQVIDDGEVPGGRLATQRLGGDRYIDIGGQFMTARDPAFVVAIAEWEVRGWVRRWCDGIPLLSATGLVDGRDGFPRWIGADGMDGFMRHLADGIDLRCSTVMAGLSALTGPGWQVSLSDGAKAVVDAVVLAIPAPRAAAFLAALRLPVPAALASVRYEPCVSVVIDLPASPGPLLPAPGAVRIDDSTSPLTWIATARGRGQATSGDILMLHLRALVGDDTRTVREQIAAATPTLVRLGITTDLTSAHIEARMWRNSRCAVPCAEPFLRVDTPSPLLLAGDGFGNCPRVEGAWLSGRAAALALIG